jgi:hypothetical protein
MSDASAETLAPPRPRLHAERVNALHLFMICLAGWINRMLAKQYGRAFLESLPKCPVEVVGDRTRSRSCLCRWLAYWLCTNRKKAVVFVADTSTETVVPLVMAIWITSD